MNASNEHARAIRARCVASPRTTDEAMAIRGVNNQLTQRKETSMITKKSPPALAAATRRRARLALRAAMASLALAASTAWPLDGAKFALLTTGITRAAAVEIAGAPDSEHCTTSFGLRVCHLTWAPLSLLGPRTSYRATFVADHLVSSMIHKE
jgi:hypothetical protein